MPLVSGLGSRVRPQFSKEKKKLKNGIGMQKEAPATQLDLPDHHVRTMLKKQ